MIGTVTDEDSVKDAMFEPQTAALPLRVTTTEPRHLHLTNRIYFTLFRLTSATLVISTTMIKKPKSQDLFVSF